MAPDAIREPGSCGEPGMIRPFLVRTIAVLVGLLALHFAIQADEPRGPRLMLLNCGWYCFGMSLGLVASGSLLCRFKARPFTNATRAALCFADMAFALGGFVLLILAFVGLFN